MLNSDDDPALKLALDPTLPIEELVRRLLAQREAVRRTHDARAIDTAAPGDRRTLH